MNRRPRPAQCVGAALGGANQLGRAGLFAHGNDDALAGRPTAGQGMGSEIIEHLRIDRLRGPAQRKLAQRGQIGLREIIAERARRLLGHIDLALLQPLDELVGRDVDDLDIGILDHRSGSVSRNPHLG